METQVTSETVRDEWDKAAASVIAAKRKETGISDWLPKFLNGSHEFERRINELIKNGRFVDRRETS